MRLWMAFLIGLLPALAWGADGDPYTSARNCSQGQYGCTSFYLCDSKDSTDEGGTCTTTVVGIPSVVEIEIAEDDGCSGAAQVALTHASSTTADAHTLGTLTKGGTTALKFEDGAAPVFPVITATLTTLTGCDATGANEGLDVVMHLLFRKP